MRIQLTIPNDRMEEIDLLKLVTGSQDYAALLDASLTAMQWLAWEVGKGRTVISVKEGDPAERELVMRELQSASEKLSKIRENQTVQA